MKVIDFETTADKFVISIDKNAMKKESVMRVIKRLRQEYLAELADIDVSILELGEEIKATWWQKNKSRFIKDDE